MKAPPREGHGMKSRAVFALLGTAAVLLGIAAAAHNFVTGQVGFNTAFTIAQTVVAAALMVIVAQDGQRDGDRVTAGRQNDGVES